MTPLTTPGPRFGELFAGAGGLSLGLERAGWTCAWHAEIADAPRAILSHRWPSVPLASDVRLIHGGMLTELYGPIDLLSGGSPCQDLSVAGKRAGLAGARSGLFYEQMRLWDETGADLCLWENVDGARSSNGGADFGEVLRAFVGAAVPVPSDGWRSAGVAAGPAGVAAWRVLDAQFFGVPQRRRRVFVLGTRTGRVDPAEVLSLAESVRGDSQPSGEAGEGPARCADAGTGEPRSVVAFDWQAGGSGDTSFRGSAAQEPISFVLGSDPISRVGGAAQPVTGRNGDPGCVLAFDQHNQITGDVTPSHGGGFPGTDGACAGHVVVGTVAATLDAAFASKQGLENQHVNQGCPNFPIQHGIPRRLTPRECERLQGWPEIEQIVILEVLCGDRPKSCVPAVTLSRKLLGSASRVGGVGSPLPAPSAGKSSSIDRDYAGSPVVLRARLDYERGTVLLQTQDGNCLWLVGTAGGSGSFGSPEVGASFVRLVATICTTGAPITQGGKAESRANRTPSSHPRNGSGYVPLSGAVIDALAGDAARFTRVLNRCTRSITSRRGDGTPLCEWTRRTFFYCVAAAISGSTLAPTSPASSYAVELTTVEGWTLVPTPGTGRRKNERLMSDAARYKAIGNGVASVHSHWIGWRLQQALGTTEAA